MRQARLSVSGLLCRSFNSVLCSLIHIFMAHNSWEVVKTSLIAESRCVVSTNARSFIRSARLTSREFIMSKSSEDAPRTVWEEMKNPIHSLTSCRWSMSFIEVLIKKISSRAHNLLCCDTTQQWQRLRKSNVWNKYTERANRDAN